MSGLLQIFSFLYERLARHRTILFISVAVLIGLSTLSLRNITLNEELNPMLPDRDPKFSRDFALLQKAPFIQRVFINLEGGKDVSYPELIETADRISGALKPPLYHRIISGPSITDPTALFRYLTTISPGLTTEDDLKHFKDRTSVLAIRKNLQTIFDKLQSPEGWVMKSLFQTDPLLLYAGNLEKLKHLNFLKGMKIEKNHFISADGRNLLLIGETPISITDVKGTKELADVTAQTLAQHVPADIQASFLSGHLYTSANAETIKKDLFVILSSASIGIFVLLFCFIRNWRAVVVYLVPASVVCIATAGVVLIDHSISAVTIAFGSVLMGIADDYPIYTYFSLRNRGSITVEKVSWISRPILFSGLTTMAIFSVLFFSDLPGQRQIAYFSIIGIIVSIILSLIVLPHLVKGSTGKSITPVASRPVERGTRNTTPVIALWSLAMAVCIWQGMQVKFDGDMRSVSMVPDSLKKTEDQLKKTWGDFRGTAMAVAEGKQLEDALQKNDQLYAFLKSKLPLDQIITLAPILPSKATQEMNRKGWADYWTPTNIAELKKTLSSEGNKAGFSPNAFDPFFDSLSVKPELVTPEGLKSAGFGDLINSLVSQDNTSHRVLTLLPDTPEVAALFSKKPTETAGIAFVSPREFNKTISGIMIKSFFQYMVIATIVMVIFLAVLFRNPEKVFLALVPVATGLLFMFGVMGAFGISFNLFNIVATILVIGLGVDLGIFMVSRLAEGVDRDTTLAVILSGLTSLFGMGTLMLARHPSLYSIGITVFLGMCGAIPSAVFIVPALYGNRYLHRLTQRSQ